MKNSAILFLSLFVIATDYSAAFNAKKDMLKADVIAAINHDVNLTWVDIAAPDGWFMPIMSTRAAEMFARLLIGTDKPISWDNFCLKEIWHFPIALYPGFGETQVAKCSIDPDVEGFFSCVYFSDKVPEKKVMIFPSFGDNVDYYVSVRVWEDQEKDWELYSPHTTISEKQKETVLQHVESLGFTRDYKTIDYSGCK